MIKMSVSFQKLFKVTQVAVVAAAFTFLSACSQDATIDKAVDALDLDHEDVFSIGVGTCFDDDNPEDEEIASVPVRECNEPHDNEIYFTFDLPDGDFPTSDEHMYAKCEAEFANFIGIKYDDSIYDYDIMSPTEYSWEEGDREVLCLVFDGKYEKLDKSLKGANK